MHIAGLTKDGFLHKIQEVIEIVRGEKLMSESAKAKRAGLNLYPKQ